MQDPEVVADSDGNYLVLDRFEMITLIHRLQILVRANRCLQIVEVGPIWIKGSTLQVAFWPYMYVNITYNIYVNLK